MEESYANNVTDEFIDPITIIDSNDKPWPQSKKVMLLFSLTLELTGEETNRSLTKWTCMNKTCTN
jgi:hypothetical protein